MKKANSLFKCFFLVLLSSNIMAQEIDYKVINWNEFSDAQNSLYKHLTSEAYQYLAKRDAEVQSINTPEGWLKRQEKIRKTMNEIIGPFPEKTPLNPKITRTIIKDGYKVEHIVFESQPGYYVTSSMFIPAGIKRNARLPVVIYVSGHSNDGYRSPAYQQVILNLVRKKFIVFAYDPVGQGERREYWDKATGKSIINGPTTEHSYPGAQAFITGSSMARYFIWDGIRAVDYLLTRKEVDPSRIGITGRSGGGTQSSHIAAMDDRILAAAPENYLTNFTRLLQSIGPQDAEQNFSRGIISGIDHPDLMIARAPKPGLMITTTRDMFNIEGAMETEKQIAKAYNDMGKGEYFSRCEDDAPHASTKKNRETMNAFFQKYLNNPGNPADEEIIMLTPEELRVTETGIVKTSSGGETVWSINRKEAGKLMEKLSVQRTSLNNNYSGIINSAKKLSGFRQPSIQDKPVFTGRFIQDGYALEKYFIKGEGNYVIPYLLLVPGKANGKAIIYIHPEGKAAEAKAGGEMEWFVKNGFTVLSPDLIGIGETGPGSYKGDAYINGSSHNLWYASILIGRSIVGVRAADVIKLKDVLKNSSGIDEVYGLAKREMSPVLLHAAAFDRSITRIMLVEPYSSYYSIVRGEFYKAAFIHNTVPGCLKEYDLPDLAASLAPAKLFILGATDGNGTRDDSQGIEQDLSVIKNAYRNAVNSLIISESAENPNEKYSRWLE